MKKLKTLRDVLGGIWAISIVLRILSKITNLYELPKWSGYVITSTIVLFIILSLSIYFKEKNTIS